MKAPDPRKGALWRRGGRFFPLLLVGCIFAVHQRSTADHCGFVGAETDCGSCVASHCQDAIDACCGDSNCRATLSALDDCAGQGSGCESLRSATNAAAPLGKCIDTNCAPVCHSITGKSGTHCSSPSFSAGTACECNIDQPPNDYTCSKTSLKNTRCCAPKGWPATGMDCTCQIASCFSTSDGCSCYLSSTATDRTSCTTPPCCSDDLLCACGVACLTGHQTEVPSCDIAHMQCPAGQVEVESCSFDVP